MEKALGLSETKRSNNILLQTWDESWSLVTPKDEFVLYYL